MSKANLDNISIKSPCNEDWEKMQGDEKTRFCGVCQKDVYNLSAMPEQEANRLLVKKGGKICVRYMRDANGRIINMPSAPPVSFVNISRIPLVAAGIVAASIAFADAAHAQDKTQIRPKMGKVKVNQKAKFAVRGTIIDTNNEPIANAEVRLLVYDTAKGVDVVVDSTKTNVDGKYELLNVPKGTYTLNVFVESKGRNQQLWKTVYLAKDETVELRYVKVDPKMTEMGEIAPDVTKPGT